MADTGVQRLDDTLRSVFVEESEADAEADDGQDDDRVRPLPNDQRCDRGRREQDQQRVAELAPKYRQWSRAMAPNGVGSIAAEPDGRLLRGEAGVGAFEPRDNLCGVQSGGFDESDA